MKNQPRRSKLLNFMYNHVKTMILNPKKELVKPRGCHFRLWNICGAKFITPFIQKVLHILKFCMQIWVQHVVLHLVRWFLCHLSDFWILFNFLLSTYRENVEKWAISRYKNTSIKKNNRCTKFKYTLLPPVTHALLYYTCLKILRAKLFKLMESKVQFFQIYNVLRKRTIKFSNYCNFTLKWHTVKSYVP